jgi:DNA-binding transcriptional regulator LsrR (DeoR family)
MPKSKKIPGSGKTTETKSYKDLPVGDVLVPGGLEISELDYIAIRQGFLAGMTTNSILDSLALPHSPQNLMWVKRALQKGLKYGLIRFVPQRNGELEATLKKMAPGVSSVSVQIDHAAACAKAAQWMNEEIAAFGQDPNNDEYVVALAGGATMLSVVNFLARLTPAPVPKGKKLTFVSLNAAESNTDFNLCCNYQVASLANLYAANHFAVTRNMEKHRAEYQRLIDHIDLLVSSVGTREGFLSTWFAEHALEYPAGAIGDIAFHFLDANGDELKLDPEQEALLYKDFALKPGWAKLHGLLHETKVALIITGNKDEMCRTLIKKGYARRFVIDGTLAARVLKTAGYLENADADCP